jgi:hypothetical protein
MYDDDDRVYELNPATFIDWCQQSAVRNAPVVAMACCPMWRIALEFLVAMAEAHSISAGAAAADAVYIPMVLVEMRLCLFEMSVHLLIADLRSFGEV